MLGGRVILDKVFFLISFMQIVPRRKRADFEFGTEGAQMIGLALFLILLAFFIMLSGLSGFSADKTQAVAQSLRETFGVSSFVYPGGDGDRLQPTYRWGFGTGDALNTISGAFENEVPGLNIPQSKRAGTLEIDIPLSAFDQMVGHGTNAPLSPLLQRLARFVQKEKTTTYRLTLAVHQRPALYPAGAGVLAERLLPRWADRLIAHGFEAKNLSLAVEPGHPGAVRLRIEPETPKTGKSS